VALAALAAGLFGMTAPLLKGVTAGVDPLVAGALLYVGAALGAGIGALVSGRRVVSVGALFARATLGRLALVALLGAALAPVLLVAGLARTDAATASLLLVLEAPFTLALARLFLNERLGPRVLAAALFIFAGGVALVPGALHPRAGAVAGLAGPALVAAATLAWALDNLLSRGLAEHDTTAIVVAKGLLGALAASGAALVTGAPPPPASAAPILALGAVGYGVSLRLYLHAQRAVGAARTASVFAIAPFVGVVVAFAAGAPWPGPALPVAAALMVVGVWLHASERHAHRHRHDPVEHDHVHSHDDGHHLHAHEPMPAGPHGHLHAHDPVEHDHEHGEDGHHRHAH
jgi:drug/metabolite transporter (DMT)-like permease